jgi:hypothetical protein
LTLSLDEILQLVEKYEKESKALKQEALKFTWYMRGGITYDDAMMLTMEDRKIIADIVTDNLETTKNTGLPYF